MKKKLMSNWSIKLISVLFAMVLWLVVVNVDDPVTTKKFKDISVDILSQNLIAEAGETYEVLDESDKVTITVKAKRSVVESLSNTDFKATADFAERISENSIPIKVEATKRVGDIVDILLQNNTVKISVEKKESKEVPVELALSGTTAEGYTVGNVNIVPGEIKIEGPASAISKIGKVVVPLDVNGASEDIFITTKGNLCDDNGNIINNPRIEGDIENIQVQVHLLHTKSIDLNLMTEGDPADDYWCQDIQYTPTTITIAGEPGDLEQINTLNIPSSELNIEGAREDIVKEIDITGYLPHNLIVCNEEEKKIRVTIIISALDGREFKIPMSEVDILNTPSGLDSILDDTKTVSVIVKGTSAAMNQLNEQNIKVSIDVKGRTAGTYTLQAEVTVPSGYIVLNRPMVSVTLIQSGEGTGVVPPNEQVPISTDTVIQSSTPLVTMPPSTTATPVPTPPAETLEPTSTPEPSDHQVEDGHEE